MENVLKKASDLYNELLKEGKAIAEAQIHQAEQATKLNDQAAAQKAEAESLSVKAERLKVYEDIEAGEKANKAEALRLASESDRILAENKALLEAKAGLQKEIASKTLEVVTAKERYEAELAAVKKTQAELKVKQDKVDKFLAQVK